MWLRLLVLVLELAAWLARRTGERRIEDAVLKEVSELQGRRVLAAAAARNDVLSGRMPPDPDDPHRRD